MCTRHEHGMVHCLQVALARRQCWVRAFQLGPTLGLLSYSTCVLVEAAGLVKLPRGSRTGVRTAAWPELVVTADGLRWPQPRAMLVPATGCAGPHLRLGAPACLLAHGAPLGLGAELRPRGPRGAAMEPLRGAAQARHCRCVRPCRHACARRGGRLAVREGGGRVRGESCGRERGRRGLENEAAVPAAVEWAGGAGGSPRRRAESVSSYSAHTLLERTRRCAIED
jgi:hypothetical protein